MTAHELARKLLAGPDVMVTVRGYEGGVNEIKFVQEPQKLALNANDENDHWYGRHTYVMYDEYEDHEHTTAIHLSA